MVYTNVSGAMIKEPYQDIKYVQFERILAATESNNRKLITEKPLQI